MILSLLHNWKPVWMELHQEYQQHVSFISHTAVLNLCNQCGRSSLFALLLSWDILPEWLWLKINSCTDDTVGDARCVFTMKYMLNNLWQCLKCIRHIFPISQLPSQIILPSPSANKFAWFKHDYEHGKCITPTVGCRILCLNFMGLLLGIKPGLWVGLEERTHRMDGLSGCLLRKMCDLQVIWQVWDMEGVGVWIPTFNLKRFCSWQIPF